MHTATGPRVDARGFFEATGLSGKAPLVDAGNYRNMAQYMDVQARTTLQNASSVVYGRSLPSSITTGYGIYNAGTPATAASIADTADTFFLTPHVVKDAVLELSSKNIPRLGETYVCFIHPAQSRQLRDHPEFIEVTKYAAPGNFMLGEVGRLWDTVVIETTQVRKVVNGAGAGYTADTTSGGITTGNGAKDRYDALLIGDNAFGHAISLPVELRDGGVLDFGREHALAWYAIYGLGLITDQAVVTIETN
mgnify:CR=1 FL=1